MHKLLYTTKIFMMFCREEIMGPVVLLRARKEEWKSQRPEPLQTNKETINLYIILQVLMFNCDKTSERNGKRYHEGNWV